MIYKKIILISALLATLPNQATSPNSSSKNTKASATSKTNWKKVAGICSAIGAALATAGIVIWQVLEYNKKKQNDIRIIAKRAEQHRLAGNDIRIIAKRAEQHRLAEIESLYDKINDNNTATNDILASRYKLTKLKDQGNLEEKMIQQWKDLIEQETQKQIELTQSENLERKLIKEQLKGPIELLKKISDYDAKAQREIKQGKVYLQEAFEAKQNIIDITTLRQPILDLAGRTDEEACQLIDEQKRHFQQTDTILNTNLQHQSTSTNLVENAQHRFENARKFYKLALEECKTFNQAPNQTEENKKESRDLNNTITRLHDNISITMETTLEELSDIDQTFNSYAIKSWGTD